MGNTLYIDLPSVEMEDFITQFRKDFRHKERTFIANIPIDCLIVWDGAEDDLPNSELRKQLETGYIVVFERRGERSVVFHPLGYSNRKYDNDNPLSGSSFGLEALCFQPDRLRVVYDDYSDSGIHTKLFLAWLEPRYQFIRSRISKQDSEYDYAESMKMLDQGMQYMAAMEQRFDGLESKLQQIEQAKKERRGVKVGTYARVAEAHRLMKGRGVGIAHACKMAGTDPRTYYQHCKAATGENPIEP